VSAATGSGGELGSAGEIAASVRAGSRSARDVVEEYLARIDALEGEVHAFNLVLADSARAAAEPPLEPPGTVSRFQGLWVGKKALCSVELPMANSSRLVLPTTTPPASAMRRTTVAS